MKFPFLSHSKNLDQNLSSSSPPWPWPSCANIKTLSFRASDSKDTIFRTFNSVFLDTQVTTPDSLFTFSSSFSSDSTFISDDPNDPVEYVIRSLRSDRLIFDPDQSCSLVSVANGGDGRGCLSVKDNAATISTDNNVICTQSLPLSRNGVRKEEENDDNDEDDKEIGKTTNRVESCKWDLEKEICTQTLPLPRESKKKEGNNYENEKVVYKNSEILPIESNNPYEDFRRSMEEMVEAYGLKDWKGLEKLLECYLKINGQQNHGFIVGAFIDLLVSFSISSTTSTTPMLTSSSSNTTTSSSSLLSSTSSSYRVLHGDDDNDDGSR